MAGDGAAGGLLQCGGLLLKYMNPAMKASGGVANLQQPPADMAGCGDSAWALAGGGGEFSETVMQIGRAHV